MTFPYLVVTGWSATDRCFVARVPALPNCAAHGDTAAKAAAEVQQAAEIMIEVLGTKAPPPDRDVLDTLLSATHITDRRRVTK